jgi:hypothetical protein
LNPCTVGNIVPKEKQVRALTIGARSLLGGSKDDDTDDEGDAEDDGVGIDNAEVI